MAKIPVLIRDTYNAYDRHQRRGVPRAGTALLHGSVSCGECGHKMVVQSKGGTPYVCKSLRQQYQVPVCQNLPADPLAAQVVAAFRKALSPVERDLYERALAALGQDDERVRRAQQQPLDRLRYQARLAERPFNPADPDNRLVTAERERRWEAALRQLKEAEETVRQQQQRLEEDE